MGRYEAKLDGRVLADAELDDLLVTVITTSMVTKRLAGKPQWLVSYREIMYALDRRNVEWHPHAVLSSLRRLREQGRIIRHGIPIGVGPFTVPTKEFA